MTERLQRALSVFGLFPSGTLGNCCTRSSLHRDAQRMLQISLSPSLLKPYRIDLKTCLVHGHTGVRTFTRNVARCSKDPRLGPSATFDFDGTLAVHR